MLLEISNIIKFTQIYTSGQISLRTNQPLVGIPRNAGDLLRGSPWLLSAVADSWILAEQCLATGEFSAMGKSTAVALVRMSVMIADQIDDASVLMSWSAPAGLSEVNTDSYFGKPEPRPPFDWDRAHLAPLFSEGWPEDWQEAQIQLAIASAGNFLDRQIDQQYPKHGAVINSEKKTKGPSKMLYLNDLVESVILVKKCGATALSGIGKVAGFTSNNTTEFALLGHRYGRLLRQVSQISPQPGLGPFQVTLLCKRVCDL